ncbi:MAG: glycosyl hydrolase 115 family protein [Bacteroidaceae bacterium]|nr:glycosyl hydrolase 115 family protein [Bacteroidaceae bacterium]
MKKLLRPILLLLAMTAPLLHTFAKDHNNITTTTPSANSFVLIEKGKPLDIVIDKNDERGISIAANNLAEDFMRVCGTKAQVKHDLPDGRKIIAGTVGSQLMKQIAKKCKLNTKNLTGKTEKYLITFSDADNAMIIIGSDRRGVIYGIYEISEQIGVSPWYYWADVPVNKVQDISINKGEYTAGEPAVRYRGIFLNDEAPCLTTWVKNTFGTNYGGHDFYAKVFELILRLRGNFLWPAMWNWSFYADDDQNSKTADEMGVIMGTSHHEPMARNHQEWARKRKEYGAWDYNTNSKVLDQFFSEGMRRAKNTEDLITIGMRGDGDAPLGGKEGHDDEFVAQDKLIMKQLENVIAAQRNIIKKETGKPAEQRPQVWALYKEVQKYYELGLKVPSDVTILLSDDNWGDVRKLPTKQELASRKGGFGMYYHVDYVGAPRNSKWLNVTPIQNLWEQMTLTYNYGVNKLWVLNVGDLKPMEYPITLFLDLAWNPQKYDTPAKLMQHPSDFCKAAFGESEAAEAANILNLYSKYNGRSTAEMLDASTYNLESGEWKQVRDEYAALETEALRQYMRLPDCAKDAYQQIILYPVQAMATIYDLYYSQAMNHKLYKEGNPQCNIWADRTQKAFDRDAALQKDFNEKMAGGKWNGMMIQKHIGYTTWNDNFPHDMMPKVFRMNAEEVQTANGGYSFALDDRGYTSIEAEHYHTARTTAATQWMVIPDMGRTLSAIALWPYTEEPAGASLSYRLQLPANTSSVKVHVIVKSTLAFRNPEGHKYTVAIDGGKAEEVNYNGNLNEKPENCYSIYYPTVARRVVESVVTLPVSNTSGNFHTLTLSPLDPAVVFEKIVVDYGGYTDQFLFGTESVNSRK